MIGSKFVKIRKDRRCYTCGTLLKKGSKMYYNCFLYDDAIRPYHQCITCMELYTRYNLGQEDTFDEIHCEEVKDVCNDYDVENPRQLLKLLKKKEENREW